MIDRLIRLCPPPSRERATIDWDALHARIGVVLPPEYREVTEVYGLGDYGAFLHLFVPCARNRFFNLEQQIEWQLDAVRFIADDYPAEAPYPLDYRTGGLLPIGLSDNGDVVFYLTDPKRPWDIVIHESRGPEWDQVEGPIDRFLARVLSGEYRSPIFPENFPDATVTFRPWEDRPSG